MTNTNKTIVIAISGLVVIILIIAGVLYFRNHPGVMTGDIDSDIPGYNASSTSSSKKPTSLKPDGSDVQAKVGAYLRANISKLSPRKATIGGTFYVTEIVFDGSSRALVDYEDGHSSYTGAVAYTIDAGGTVHVTDFNILEK